MEEWKTYKLKDITTKIGSGATPSGGKEAYLGGDIALVRSQNVLDLNFSKEGLAYISDEQAQKLSNVELSLNDTLINITGDSVARVCTLPSWVLPARVNQHVAIVRPDKKYVVSKYLTYYLLTQKEHLLSLSSCGATRKALTKGMLEDLDILLPSLAYQERIVNILGSIDDKIELNNRINHNLEEQAQAVFDSIFDNPTKEKALHLDSIADINPKRTLAKGTSARCIDMSYLSTSGSFPSGWDYRQYSGGMKFINGDTLMARITPCLENGKVAYVNFLEKDEVAFGSTEYIVFHGKDGFPNEMFYFLTRNQNFIDYATKNMNGSSGRQRVSGETIGQYMIPELSEEELEKIKTCSKAAMVEILRNSLESINLKSMRDSLLSRLMSGEITC